MMDYTVLPTSSLALGISILAIFSFFFRRYWRLRHVPGPFLASITNLWRAYIQMSRPICPVLLELHKKYGPVVRIGPNTLHISDPACINIIYTNRGQYLKADSYRLMRAFVNNKSSGSLIDMQDESQNRLMRKAIGGTFLTRNLLDYEPDVDTTLSALIHRITDHPTFNLYQMLQFFQLDFLIKMAFSESPGHLAQGRDVLGLAKQGSLRIWHWYLWQPLPYLEQFIYHSPIWSRFISRPTRWAKTGIERWEARKEQNKLSTSRKQPGKNDLLQKYIEVSEKYPDTIKPATAANLVNSTISAGGDTTAGTMATMIYFLLKNPFAYNKLQKELEDAVKSGVLSPEPRYSELNTLPYLDAVMKETLRLNPPLAAPLERVVPKGGALLSGVPVPEGTVVGCTGRVVHLDHEVYCVDAEAFRPERWLEGGEGRRQGMERGYMPFGSGGRICLGRYVVELEVKRVVPGLMLGFEMSLCDLTVELPLQNGMLEFDANPIMVRFEPRK